MLCGDGYEWQECVNGEIPIGAVTISQTDSDPVFIAREHQAREIGPVYANGKMLIVREHYINEISEFEILVARNVKNREWHEPFIYSIFFLKFPFFISVRWKRSTNRCNIHWV